VVERLASHQVSPPICADHHLIPPNSIPPSCANIHIYLQRRRYDI